MRLAQTVDGHEHPGQPAEPARALPRLIADPPGPEWTGAVVLAAAVAGLWLIAPPRGLALLPSVICVVALAVAIRARPRSRPRLVAPDGLACAALLFVVPAAIVPVAALISLGLADLRDLRTPIVLGRRMVRASGQAWFAVIPALVLALGGAQPMHVSAGLLLAALSAPIVVDLMLSTLRDQRARRASRRAAAAHEDALAVPAIWPLRPLRCDDETAVLRLPRLPRPVLELLVARVTARYLARHPDAAPRVTMVDRQVRIAWNTYGARWRELRRWQLDPRLQPGAYVSREASLYEVVKRTASQIVLECARTGALRATSPGDVLANYALRRPT